MTLAEVVKALKAENVLMPSGTIYSSGTTTDVRVKAQYADESELSQIQVTNAKGAKIPITAVAPSSARTSGSRVMPASTAMMLSSWPFTRTAMPTSSTRSTM